MTLPGRGAATCVVGSFAATAGAAGTGHFAATAVVAVGVVTSLVVDVSTRVGVLASLVVSTLFAASACGDAFPCGLAWTWICGCTTTWICGCIHAPPVGATPGAGIVHLLDQDACPL